MAERVGFEPTSELPRYSISSAAPSTSSDTAPSAVHHSTSPSHRQLLKHRETELICHLSIVLT
jgi:hypothetical protein